MATIPKPITVGHWSYCIVGPNGQNAKWLLEQVEKHNRTIQTIVPAGDCVHYTIMDPIEGAPPAGIPPFMPQA